MRIMKSKSFYESFQENLKKEDALLESANQKPKRKLKENIEELQPKYAGRNSFYGKAFVETDGNKKTLTSYKTKIMTIEDGKITMLCDEDALTQTTLRHIREFLQQNGIKPLTRKELVDKINGGKNLDESNPAFKDKYKVTINGEEIKPGYKIKDFRGDEHVFLGVTNPGTPFGGMNGKIRVASGDGEMEYYPSVFNAKLEKIDESLEEAFDLDTALADVTEWAESIYKGSEINSSTIKSLLNSKEELKDKYTDNQKAKIVKWFEDEEKKYMPMQEQDQTVRVVTANNDREYTIVDITELNTVSDGDVQAPIDISELLVNVDSKLSESYGSNWGEINFQSTRFNNDTKDSNALFELSVGDKTYLMSMLLEENGTVLKVNNTKGQTIFKRKTKDIVGLTESYIKQFIPKEEKEVPEVIKHINADLHDVLNFLKLQIELGKDVPKGEKEAFDNYLQNQIYAFVAEVSNEIKASEPTEEDKLELPSFDKMVEEIFGKQWVKKEPEQKKLELDGVEEIKESAKLKESVYDKIEVGNEVYWVGAGNEISATGKVVDLPTEGRMTVKWDDGDVNTYDVDHPSIIRAELYDDSFNECDKSKLKEAADEKTYDKLDWADKQYLKTLAMKRMNGWDDEVVRSDDWYINLQNKYGKELIDDAYDYLINNFEIDPESYVHDDGYAETVLRRKLKEADEPEEKPTEEPKNGLGTGNATFARKPSNISDVESKSKSFTSGDSSYLICSKEKISKDEFDGLQENFTTPNKWCREFKPIDTENYAFNVIEFSCPDYSYKLLVDPSDSDYCKYVSKVGE